MPYARKNWKLSEVLRILQNPINSSLYNTASPSAHSKIHALEDELRKHPLFQAARVRNEVIELRKGKITSSKEAAKHSTADASIIAAALVSVLNSQAMQPHLIKLDQAKKTNDIKFNLTVYANFNNPIGNGTLYNFDKQTRSINKQCFQIKALFVYLKPNPSNADLPIFQTVVPYDTHIAHSNNKIVISINN